MRLKCGQYEAVVKLILVQQIKIKYNDYMTRDHLKLLYPYVPVDF